MRIGAFDIHEPVPELIEPHVFTMIRPWVDVASVATITLDRLERHFGAREFGRLARPGNYFDFTRYRPTITLVEGQRQVTIPNSVINHARSPEGIDLLFFHLLEPHAFGEEYAESVLEVFKQFAIRRYCRLGAMYDAVPHTRPLKVTGDTGNVPSKGNAGNLRRRRSTYQGPTTIMNLVSEGVSKLEPEVDVVTLMVHLPQYLQIEEDHVGASRLLQVLSSMYDLPEDLGQTTIGQRQYTELDQAVERNPELKALIQRMESQYDSEERAAGEGEESASAPLSPEVEQFLEEMDQRFSGTEEPG